MHEVDSVRVQAGGSGCETGEEVNGTNIVVMNDAIGEGTGRPVYECILYIPMVSMEIVLGCWECSVLARKFLLWNACHQEEAAQPPGELEAG